MIKDFITWLYAKYVVAPEFEDYLHRKFTQPEHRCKEHSDEIAIALIEKRFAPRVDH